MISAFENCVIFDANLGNWIVDNVFTMEKMFKNCKIYKGEGLDNWNIENWTTNITEIFEGCDNIILPKWSVM